MNDSNDSNYRTLREDGVRTLFEERETEIEIPTATSQHEACSILEFEAGTNGYHNGDSGHGGRTYLRLENVCSVDMHVRVNGGAESRCRRLEIILGGDEELTAIKAALTFALTTLEQQSSTAQIEQSNEVDFVSAS